MPFQLSPGVNVSEIDLTTIVPAVATTDAAAAGVFQWGPVGKATLVVSEDELVKEYGKPNSDNFETWFSASNFLAYSNRLYVSRAGYTEGTDVVLAPYVYDGGNYLVITGNTATGVQTGFDAVESSVIPADTSVTAVSTAQVDVSVGFATDVDTGNNTIDVALGTDLVEGERVQLIRDGGTGTLPSPFAEGTDYYVFNVTANAFQLSTDQFGGTAVTIGDTGDTDFVVRRSGDTRITLNNNVNGPGGDNGIVSVEIYDEDFTFNAIANTAALGTDSTLANHIVKNDDAYDDASQNFDSAVQYVAKYPGALGNSLQISVCDSAAAFESEITIPSTQAANASVAVATTLTLNVGERIATLTTDSGQNEDLDAVTDDFAVGDLLKFGNSSVGFQWLEVEAIGAGDGTSKTITFTDNLAISENIDLESGDTFDRFWKYYDLVQKAPGQSQFVAEQGNTSANDEMHIVVIDEDGKISGVPNTVLEVFQEVSRATDAKGIDGEIIYYKEVLNQSSRYVWAGSDRSGSATTTAALISTSTATTPETLSFGSGTDVNGGEGACTLGQILRSYDVFRSSEDYDISLVVSGKARGGANGTQIANYIIDNICERRKDCVSFVSPAKQDVVNNFSDISEDVIAFRNSMRSTSYAVMDSGYKYQYDKFNDVYRWIPLNGDIAGLCARTDDLRDAWWSPAGFNRGNIKNVIKLSWNPKKGERDVLYANGINPVVNFPGQGIVLFGDKTLLSKPSAFDRINVRRLFIVLEKAIAAASQSTLFEFNDEFTRSTFVNLVTPFLRDVQARRGITDFAVVCDETNNTGEVIDRNEFVGDIYVKPARAINFIQLNFVAVRSGVEFSEVVGNF
jgi:hypothetical protein